MRFRRYSKSKNIEIKCIKKSKYETNTFVRSDANIDEAMSHNETDTQQSWAPWVNTDQPTEKLNEQRDNDQENVVS